MKMRIGDDKKNLEGDEQKTLRHPAKTIKLDQIGCKSSLRSSERYSMDVVDESASDEDRSQDREIDR